MMHDELVGRLREPCQYENCILCQQAADAIEELSNIREEQKAQIIAMAAETEELKKEAERWQAEAKDWYLAYMDLLPDPPKEET